MSGPVINVPGLGYSIIANLGDDRQLTVQCYAPSDEELPVIHAAVDKAMAVVDRQRAKYKLKDYEAERDKLVKTLRNFEDDLGRCEETFILETEKIDAMLLEFSGKVGKIEAEARDRGRRKPVGAEAAQVNAINGRMKELTAAKEKLVAERNQQRANLATTVGRYREEIEKVEGLIAETLAVLET